MAKRIRHILVALGDVGRAPSGQLRNAGALARASGASIELFHALAEPSPKSGHGVEKARIALVALSRGFAPL